MALRPSAAMTGKAVRAAAILAMAGLGAAIAGCGGGGGGTSASTGAPTQAQPATGGSTTIKMSDYAFTPKAATAPAGSLKITTPNEGKVPHEFVLIQSNADPSSFKATGATVNEDAIGTNAGESGDVAPGQTKTTSFKL